MVTFQEQMAKDSAAKGEALQRRRQGSVGFTAG